MLSHRVGLDRDTFERKTSMTIASVQDGVQFPLVAVSTGHWHESPKWQRFPVRAVLAY